MDHGLVANMFTETESVVVFFCESESVVNYRYNNV